MSLVAITGIIGMTLIVAGAIASIYASWLSRKAAKTDVQNNQRAPAKHPLFGKKMVVVIREKDNRKTEIEATLIHELIASGVEIMSIQEAEIKTILAGGLPGNPIYDFALSAVTWENYRELYGYFINLDYRLLKRETPEKINIIAAGKVRSCSTEANAEQTLAVRLLRNIADNLAVSENTKN